MRKVLNFIGTGTAFSKENINNSAFYKTRDKLILFDCGETIFHEILNKNIIDESIKVIDIIITHFHSDHVGSLGSLVLYCQKNKKEVNIIFPDKEMPVNLLTLFGVNKDLYTIKTPIEVKDYYLKEYKQLHGYTDINNQIVKIPSYGYHFINDNDNLFYSGDSSIIPDEIIKMFKEKDIYYLYQDVSDDGNKTHLQVNELINLIEPNYRKRVMCMHLTDSCDIKKIKENGFETAR